VLLGTLPTEAERLPHGEVTVAPWTCLGFEGVKLSSRHWDICTTIRIPTLCQQLPQAMEAALAHMRETLGGPELTLPCPRAPMTTCLMSDRRQWSNLARVLHPEHAEAMEGLSRGGFTAEGVALLYDIDRREHCRNTIALALHEGWHQYAQTALRAPLEPWLDEGLATIMEGYRLTVDGPVIDHDANRQRKRRAWWLFRRGRMPSVDTLLAGDPHEAMDRGRTALLDYYAQAWAFMRFMLDDPDRARAVRDVLAAAVDGTRKPIDLPPGDIDAQFRAWCVEGLRPTWWH
jgi:hypothetical protein